MQAAQQLGRVNAGVQLADLPPECRQEVPHASIVIGQGIEGLLKREQHQLDVANDRLIDCGDFYLDQKALMEYATKAEDRR